MPFRSFMYTVGIFLGLAAPLINALTGKWNTTRTRPRASFVPKSLGNSESGSLGVSQDI